MVILIRVSGLAHLLAFFNLLIIHEVQGQFLSNPEFLLRKQLEIDSIDRPSFRLESSKISEAKLLGIGMIRFYQKFISSQDKSSCIFTLSCSQFGIEAIKNKGLLKGALLAADRLMRCNSTAAVYYQQNTITLKAEDPVPLYLFHNPQAR